MQRDWTVPDGSYGFCLTPIFLQASVFYIKGFIDSVSCLQPDFKAFRVKDPLKQQSHHHHSTKTFQFRIDLFY